MAPGGPNRKVANSLVTLSSAAILTVYAAGLMKTRAAAELLEEASNERRPAMPAPATAGETAPPAPIEPPADVAKATTSLSPAVVVTPAPKPAATPATVSTAEKKTPTKATAAPMPKATPAVATADPALVPAASIADKATQPAPAASATAATTDTTSPTPPATTTPTPAATPATPAPADDKPAPLPRPKEIYTDGTYLGWGSSRHGDIQAAVTIEDGRIVAAKIARCLTRYSCSWVSHLPPQVVARQSPEVDYVSGATQSANAFYWAVVDALSKAK